MHGSLKQLIAPILLAGAVLVGAIVIGVFGEPPGAVRPPDRLPGESWSSEIVQLPKGQAKARPAKPKRPARSASRGVKARERGVKRSTSVRSGLVALPQDRQNSRVTPLAGSAPTVRTTPRRRTSPRPRPRRNSTQNRRGRRNTTGTTPTPSNGAGGTPAAGGPAVPAVSTPPGNDSGGDDSERPRERNRDYGDHGDRRDWNADDDDHDGDDDDRRGRGRGDGDDDGDTDD
jgi:hypothetical protein